MIKIYGTNKCFYCRLAKELCKKNKIRYTFYDINTIENKNKLIILKKQKIIPNKVSIPIIFKNNKYIGGFSELEKIIENISYSRSKRSKRKTRSKSLRKK